MGITIIFTHFYWTKMVRYLDTFILDFEKAFDTPPSRELLKSKLFSYGIGGKTLEWTLMLFCASGSKG